MTHISGYVGGTQPHLSAQFLVPETLAKNLGRVPGPLALLNGRWIERRRLGLLHTRHSAVGV